MHALIDAGMVDSIRQSGNINSDMPDRRAFYEQHGLPYDRKADWAVITGCQMPGALPQMLASLSRIFTGAGVSYTFLTREYCCGNMLYRPAIKARDEEAMAECRGLSREFVGRTIEEARSYGARRLVIFCSPCYPIYKHAFPDEDIVFYPAAISEAVGPMAMDGRVDYYAGCYKLHRRFAPVPMDLKSTNKVLSQIEGLEVNRIKAPKCCFSPDGLAHMIGSVETKSMVHICSGCYIQAQRNMPPEKGVEVLMLPELVERALRREAVG